MKNRNIKVVDEHAIDRDANIIFALDLEGSEYVVYWIGRDENTNNIFVSKVIKNIDGTFNLLDIEDSLEKSRVSELVKSFISKSVSDESDKLSGDTLTLSDGKVVKFIGVSFNKEQRFNVQKTYITTVKKEVTKVSETYYDVVASDISTEVNDIFPSVSPVVPEVKSEPVTSTVVATPVETLPKVEVVMPSVSVAQPEPVGVVVEPITVSTQPEPVVSQPVESPVVAPVAPVLPEVNTVPTEVVTEPVVVQPTPVQVTPVVAEPVITTESSPELIFNAAKEVNLNAALGEVANSTTIPVENIEPVREFGVEEPLKQEVPAQPAVVVAPVGTDNATGNVGGVSPVVTKKAGFANNKFFMVIAITFFLASCIFLGYEVFNYFQLVK